MSKKSFLSAVSCLVLCLLMACLLPFLKTDAKTVPSPDNCIAHRGAMEYAPEGTLAAFQAAADIGYKQFECDIWYTKSGEIFVCHDSTLKRQTGKQGFPWNLSTKNRKKYPIIHGSHVKDYPTQYFPRLDEALRFARDHKMRVFLHLKSNRNSTFTAKAVKKLIRTIRSFKGLKSPVLITSNVTVARQIRTYKGKKGLVTTSSSSFIMRRSIRLAKSLAFKYIIFPYYSGQRTEKNVIRYAKNKKLNTIFYRIKSVSAATAVFNRGAGMCFTDKCLFR